MLSASIQGRYAQAGSTPVIIYLWTSLTRRCNRSECLCKDPLVHPPAMGPNGPLQSRLPRSDTVINCPIQCREHFQETISYQVKWKEIVVDITISTNIIQSLLLVVLSCGIKRTGKRKRKQSYLLLSKTICICIFYMYTFRQSNIFLYYTSYHNIILVNARQFSLLHSNLCRAKPFSTIKSDKSDKSDIICPRQGQTISAIKSNEQVRQFLVKLI